MSSRNLELVGEEVGYFEATFFLFYLLISIINFRYKYRFLI